MKSEKGREGKDTRSAIKALEIYLCEKMASILQDWKSK